MNWKKRVVIIRRTAYYYEFSVVISVSQESSLLPLCFLVT